VLSGNHSDPSHLPLAFDGTGLTGDPEGLAIHINDELAQIELSWVDVRYPAGAFGDAEPGIYCEIECNDEYLERVVVWVDEDGAVWAHGFALVLGDQARLESDIAGLIDEACEHRGLDHVCRVRSDKLDRASMRGLLEWIRTNDVNFDADDINVVFGGAVVSFNDFLAQDA
jgi:hypothetical protein